MDKINLKQLVEFFVQSASDGELPTPIRRFAAQLTVLTAHVERVEAKVNAEIQARRALEARADGQIAELAGFLMAARQAAGATATAPAAATSPAAETAAPVDDEDAEAQAMADRIIAETEAEVAAITKAPPQAAITPLRKAKAGGAAKSTEEAS